MLPIAVMSSTIGRPGQGDQRAVRGLRLSKEAQLDDDIRLLGRVLGDVVREQAGERVFELVERVRRLALAVYRDGADDAELVDLLCSLEVRDALNVVRAFSYFSSLANIAEDVQSERRWRAHRIAGRRPAAGQRRRRARPPAARRRRHGRAAAPCSTGCSSAR